MSMLQRGIQVPVLRTFGTVRLFDNRGSNGCSKGALGRPVTESHLLLKRAGNVLSGSITHCTPYVSSGCSGLVHSCGNWGLRSRSGPANTYKLYPSMLHQGNPAQVVRHIWRAKLPKVWRHCLLRIAAMTVGILLKVLRPISWRGARGRCFFVLCTLIHVRFGTLKRICCLLEQAMPYERRN